MHRYYSASQLGLEVGYVVMLPDALEKEVMQVQEVELSPACVTL